MFVFEGRRIIGYMYLRRSNQKRADGSVLSHLQIAENVWDPIKKRSRVRIIHNCGRSDDPKATERLRRLARSILKRCSPEELVADDPSLRVVDSWPYGDVYVLEHLWREVGLPGLIGELLDNRKFEFSIERALFAMVANRACAPSSKLYCHEQWLAEDVRIEGCESLELHHLYRAMDFLEAHKEALEEGLYFRMADLLNLDVEVVFYDTTTTWIQKSTLPGCGRSGFVARRTGAAGGRRLYRNGMADGDRVLSHPHLANEQAYDTLTLGKRHCLRPFTHTPKESFHRRGQGKPRATVELRSLQRVQFRQDGTLSGL